MGTRYYIYRYYVWNRLAGSSPLFFDSILMRRPSLSALTAVADPPKNTASFGENQAILFILLGPEVRVKLLAHKVLVQVKRQSRSMRVTRSEPPGWEIAL
jgi:hypothetical protein